MLDLLRWIGGLILFTPMMLFAIPTFPTVMEKIYYGRDELELVRYRRQWVPILISFLLLVPDILLLKSDEERTTELLWKIAVVWIYIAVPFIVCMCRPAAKLPLDTGDLVTVLLIACPVIASYYTDSLPDPQIKIRDGWPRISTIQITAVNCALCVFNGLRPLKDFGYTVIWNCGDILRFLTGLIVAAAILLPIGYATSSFEKAAHPNAGLAIAQLLTVFVVYSLPQEILFRGIIQNLLHSRLESNADITKYTSQKDNKGALSMREWPNYSAVDGKEGGESPDEEDNNLFYESDIARRNPETFQDIHQEFYKRGVCCWLTLPTIRDWIALIISSFIYAFSLMDHRHWDNNGGVAFTTLLILGMVCGYTWRQTSKVTTSAAVHAFVTYVGIYILKADMRATI
ncbi:hypothetical protein AAMO2058_001584900 [Amorphochlora amoebiformis]